MIEIESIYDVPTATFSYLVWDSQTQDAIIIDPVLNFDSVWMKISRESVDNIMWRVKKLGLKVHFVFDTHPHADHLSAATLLSSLLDAKSAISERFSKVRSDFSFIFNVSIEQLRGDYDRYLSDGEQLSAGSISIDVIATPGHTPACLSLKIGGAVFVGDALFQPHIGTGRTDFPSGSAVDLYNSIQRLYGLTDDTQVYTGHDYPVAGAEAQASFSLIDAKRHNKYLPLDCAEKEYVLARTIRDQALSPPKLLYFSMWANINCGDLPQSAAGTTIFPIPVRILE